MEIWLNVVLTAIPSALIAWLCAYISRPVFMQRWTRIASQTLASWLLLMAYTLSKGLSAHRGAANADESALLTIGATYFGMKFIAMYCIASYAKSVGKSPYWSFVGVLNFAIAFILLIGFWKSKAREGVLDEIRIDRLNRIIDDPNTPQERRDWARDRLARIEGQAVSGVAETA